MNFYFASGMWSVWYVALWLTVVPFLVMLVWLFARLAPPTANEESTALNGSVLGAFFLLLATSFVSTIFFVRAQPSPTLWTYARWLALHVAVWTFLGSSIFFASLKALGIGPNVGLRRAAGVLACAGALAAHAASLYATWRFRGGR